ncbi:helix-turn-helix domain-containing protein [Labedella populi]|nr:helix-turn-helix domain-containing protein [Labedella populi]
MTARVEAGLRAVRIVAERTDPTAPIGSGAIARSLGVSPSSASRLCAELVGLRLLEEGGAYGSFRLGPAAVRLSGRSAAPVAHAVRYALTIAAQYTGETACLAARSGEHMHIVATVGSEWTLHAPADLGERITEGSAIARAGRTADVSRGETTDASDSTGRIVESTAGKCIEVATAVLGPDGEGIAVVAIRLPVNRSRGGVPRARRAVEAARRRIEAVLADASAAGGPAADPDPGSGTSDSAERTTALEATVRVLQHLAATPDSVTGVARGTGIRADRVVRLLDSCARAGVVESWAGRGAWALTWGVHGWHRAATGPTLTTRGRQYVARAAADTGTYGFITILRGIRSFTVVEELGDPDGGLVMMPWLGRPHPIIGSDGGPTLVMDFAPDDLARLLGKRHARHEFDALLSRMETVARDGVISIESIEEAGLLSVSAPIRDASGLVVGAACLTCGADAVGPDRRGLEEATLRLAADLSRLLG